jgi:hypothetical protein
MNSAKVEPNQPLGKVEPTQPFLKVEPNVNQSERQFIINLNKNIFFYY